MSRDDPFGPNRDEIANRIDQRGDPGILCGRYDTAAIEATTRAVTLGLTYSMVVLGRWRHDPVSGLLCANALYNGTECLITVASVPARLATPPDPRRAAGIGDEMPKLNDWTFWVGTAGSVDSEDVYEIGNFQTRKMAIEAGNRHSAAGQEFRIIEARTWRRSECPSDGIEKFARVRNGERLVAPASPLATESTGQ